MFRLKIELARSYISRAHSLERARPKIADINGRDGEEKKSKSAGNTATAVNKIPFTCYSIFITHFLSTRLLARSLPMPNGIDFSKFTL
jgi:hypothetical protein